MNLRPLTTGAVLVVGLIFCPLLVAWIGGVLASLATAVGRALFPFLLIAATVSVFVSVLGGPQAARMVSGLWLDGCRLGITILSKLADLIFRSRGHRTTDP